MTETVKLLTGRLARPKKDAKYYTIDERRKIINFWKERYEDAIIQIVPDHDIEGENKWTEQIEKAYANPTEDKAG